MTDLSDDEHTIDTEALGGREPRVGCFVLITPWRRLRASISSLYEITRIIDCEPCDARCLVLELNAGEALYLARCTTGEGLVLWHHASPHDNLVLPAEFVVGACVDAAVAVLDAALDDRLPHGDVEWHEPCRDGHWIRLDASTTVRAKYTGSSTTVGEPVFRGVDDNLDRHFCRIVYPLPHWRYVKLVKTKLHGDQYGLASGEHERRSRGICFLGLQLSLDLAPDLLEQQRRTTLACMPASFCTRAAHQTWRELAVDNYLDDLKVLIDQCVTRPRRAQR